MMRCTRIRRERYYSFSLHWELAKANWWGKFSIKSNWMIAVSYLMKKNIKKIFLELISNTKIFNIKFYSMIFPTIEILPNLQGDWTALNTVLIIEIQFHFSFCSLSRRSTGRKSFDRWALDVKQNWRWVEKDIVYLFIWLLLLN